MSHYVIMLLIATQTMYAMHPPYWAMFLFKRPETILSHAIENRNYERVQYMLAKGYATCYDNDGLTPLHHAAWHGDAYIVSQLLGHGAETNHPDKRQITPIFLAALHNDHKIVSLLHRNGAHINIHNGIISLLHAAAMYQADRVISVLLENGATCDIRAHTQRTPLHLAASRRNKAAFQELALSSKNINPRDSIYGQTPLHIATQSRITDYIDFLLKRGAHHDIQNASSHTPLDIAFQSGDSTCLYILLAHGAHTVSQHQPLEPRTSQMLEDVYHGRANTSSSIYIKQCIKVALGQGLYQQASNILSEHRPQSIGAITEHIFTLATLYPHRQEALSDFLNMLTRIYSRNYIETETIARMHQKCNDTTTTPQILAKVLETFPTTARTYVDSSTGNTICHYLAKMPRFFSAARPILMHIVPNASDKNNVSVSPIKVAYANEQYQFIPPYARERYKKALWQTQQTCTLTDIDIYTQS